MGLPAWPAPVGRTGTVEGILGYRGRKGRTPLTARAGTPLWHVPESRRSS